MPGNDEAVAFDHRAQIVLFEIGFLHQPIGEAPQQLRLRPAAFETARPEPHLVGQQLRHPALPDAIEDQQRFAVIAVHHGNPALHMRIDLPEPTSPGRLAARRAGPRQVVGHRMAAAEIGQLRLEPLLVHIAGRLGRQDRPERRAGKAHRGAEARAGRFEKGAALAHIARDVFEIGLRDHAPAAVAVEDDQVEFVELDVEQFADRKGDQRQFADRRAVLLFRRPQDREMDEVDRGIGFEDVAPDALAGMRLARDEQHPQAVAHAIDHDDGMIVVERQLARARLDRKLENIGSAVIDRQGQWDIAADRHGHLPRRAAILAPRHDRLALCALLLAGGALRQILDPDLQLQFLADQAKARRLGDDQPAVALVGQAREQNVERRADRLGGRLGVAGGDVVHLPVGDHDDAREALSRHVGHRAREGGEQARPVIAGAGLRLSRPDHADIEVALASEAIAERRQRRFGRMLAIADPLARQFVDDDDRGIALRVALFFDHRWVDESGEQDRDGDHAPQHAPRAAQNPEGEKEQARGAERGDRVPRQERRGGERKRIAGH